MGVIDLLLEQQNTRRDCCSNPNEGTLLLCVSVYTVSVDVLTHAVDLHKTASH